MYLVYRIRVKKRLTAKGHDSFDVILRRYLSHGISGNFRIYPLAASAVVALGAMLAPLRAGIGHDKLNLVQIFKMRIHFSFVYGDRARCEFGCPFAVLV